MTQIQAKDVLYDEILEHAIQCRILNERYFPRDEIFEKVIIFLSILSLVLSLSIGSRIFFVEYITTMHDIRQIRFGKIIDYVSDSEQGKALIK
jgi:hypothetical protein